MLLNLWLYYKTCCNKFQYYYIIKKYLNNINKEHKNIFINYLPKFERLKSPEIINLYKNKIQKLGNNFLKDLDKKKASVEVFVNLFYNARKVRKS